MMCANPIGQAGVPNAGRNHAAIYLLLLVLERNFCRTEQCSMINLRRLKTPTKSAVGHQPTRRSDSWREQPLALGNWARSEIRRSNGVGL